MYIIKIIVLIKYYIKITRKSTLTDLTERNIYHITMSSASLLQKSSDRRVLLGAITLVLLFYFFINKLAWKQLWQKIEIFGILEWIDSCIDPNNNIKFSYMEVVAN